MPWNLNCVCARHGSVWRQFRAFPTHGVPPPTGVTEPTVGAESCRTSHVSYTVRPVLTPPDTTPPWPNLALIETSTPLKTCVTSPKFDAWDARFSTCPNTDGFGSASPQIW